MSKMGKTRHPWGQDETLAHLAQTDVLSCTGIGQDDRQNRKLFIL